MKTITQRLSEHFTFIACMFLSMNDILLPKMMYYCQKSGIKRLIAVARM